jgi:predicted nucleic acid-binding Zn ribbon protein
VLHSLSSNFISVSCRGVSGLSGRLTRRQRGKHVQEIGTVLPAIFKQYVQRGQPRLVEVLAPFWPRVTGKAIAANSRPVFFAAGTLVVTTPLSPWAVQLRGMSEEIRAAVNSFLGGPVVKRLRIELRTATNVNAARTDLEN